jgi:hypothetical protein
MPDVLRPSCAPCCPADAVLDKACVWGAPLAPDSPLLSAATCAKLSPAEAAQVPRLAQVLLLQHTQRLKKGEPRRVCGGVGWGGAVAVKGEHVNRQSCPADGHHFSLEAFEALCMCACRIALHLYSSATREVARSLLLQYFGLTADRPPVLLSTLLRPPSPRCC